MKPLEPILIPKSWQASHLSLVQRDADNFLPTRYRGEGGEGRSLAYYYRYSRIIPNATRKREKEIVQRGHDVPLMHLRSRWYERSPEGIKYISRRNLNRIGTPAFVFRAAVCSPRRTCFHRGRSSAFPNPSSLWLGYPTLVSSLLPLPSLPLWRIQSPVRLRVSDAEQPACLPVISPLKTLDFFVKLCPVQKSNTAAQSCSFWIESSTLCVSDLILILRC